MGAARGRVLRLVWVAAGLGLAILALRALVGDVFRVRSGSMRPTIVGGTDPRSGATPAEHVLVRYGGGDLERFDLVVVRHPTSRAPIVKRVGGLPGERVALVDGDLVVDGAPLPPDAPRPAPIPLFDSRLEPLEAGFLLDAGSDGPWSRADAGAWRVDARAVPTGSDAAMALLDRPVDDGWLADDGTRVPGTHEVGDAVLAAAVQPLEAGGELVLRLVEDGDTFEARLAVGGAPGRAVLVRRNARTLARSDAAAREEVLAEGPAPLPVGAWTEVALSNVDDHVALAIGGDTVLGASYAGNATHPAPTAPGARSVGARAGLGAHGARLAVRDVRVARDLHYVAAGRHGVGEPVALGPDELFLLGDDSAHSRDSRDFGPVALERVIGRPVAVVWPPSRARRLAGAR